LVGQLVPDGQSDTQPQNPASAASRTVVSIFVLTTIERMPKVFVNLACSLGATSPVRETEVHENDVWPVDFCAGDGSILGRSHRTDLMAEIRYELLKAHRDDHLITTGPAPMTERASNEIMVQRGVSPGEPVARQSGLGFI
jgi:hypothetical protein